MRHVSRRHTGWLLAAAVVLAPVAAHAQTKAAGVVTTLQGEASVTRVSTAQPAPTVQPLKFRENVFAQDLITTGDRSLARILLGGAAVVTVREHSTLRISEQGSTATVDITSGKVALVVAKERMAGRRIDVRTPNAIAGVRGTILITEVGPSAASGPQSTSTFTLLDGVVDVSLLDPAGQRVGAPVTLNALQTLGISGFNAPPPPHTITRAEGEAVASSFHVDLKEPPTGTTGVSDDHVNQAANAANTGAASAGAGINFAAFTPPPPSPTTVVTGDDTRNGSNHNPAMDTGGGTPPPIVCRFCECSPSCGAAALRATPRSR